MTPQERDNLTLFLKQLGEARAEGKDSDADRLIRETASKHPDAAYLLVQRAMLVEQALNIAKAQIAELQSQVQSSQAGSRNSGFLGSGNPWAQSLDRGAGSGGVPGAGSYQIPRAAPGAYAAPAAAPQASSLGGGAGSFLGSIATTAAGVAAGGFLFQGLESLLGHHQSPSSSWGGPADEQVSEQTIINNYYDTPPENELARNDDWPQSDFADNSLADNDTADPGFDDSDDSSWV
jgi:hypothetical protein